MPPTPHASPASLELAPAKHSHTPFRSHLSDLEPAKSTASPSHQPNSSTRLQQAARSQPIDLQRMSPFVRTHRPFDQDKCFLNQPQRSQEQGRTAASRHQSGLISAFGSSARHFPSPSHDASHRHSHQQVHQAGAGKFAHNGPVHHILVVKDRVVTNGGIGMRCNLREWSFLGKLIASHEACNTGDCLVTTP